MNKQPVFPQKPTLIYSSSIHSHQNLGAQLCVVTHAFNPSTLEQRQAVLCKFKAILISIASFQASQGYIVTPPPTHTHTQWGGEGHKHT